MGHSRGRKIKSLGDRYDSEVFWLSLEEAKRAIADKFQFLEDRHDRRYRKDKYTKAA